jgi:hypothetical protein
MVDGAVSGCIAGSSGLLAGCSFARDVLKCFLLELSSMVDFQVRDYVDVIVVVYEAEDARLCASGLKARVEQAKLWLRALAVFLTDD